MKIVKYKQYLVDGCKTICSLRYDDCGDYDGLSAFKLDSVDRGYFRTMLISISETSTENPVLDLGDYVVPPDYAKRGEEGYPRQYNYYAKYIQVLLGELPDWSPVRVDISPDSLMFYFVKYDDKDFCEQIGFLEMKCPPRFSMCVEILEPPEDGIYPRPDGNSEKYIITVDTKPQRQPEITVSEYKGITLRRTAQIRTDDKGVYEFITEA